METAKVTPAAFTACRSIGASSQGRAGSRVSGGVLASNASRLPTGSPSAARRAAAGSADSHKSRIVGKWREMSTAAPSRIATTEGPPASGRHTLPASAALAASSGSNWRAASARAIILATPSVVLAAGGS